MKIKHISDIALFHYNFTCTFCHRSLLKSAMYVSRLEALGRTSSVEQFSSVDKSALVEGLWRSQRHNPKALCLMTDICIDYNVGNCSLTCCSSLCFWA